MDVERRNSIRNSMSDKLSKMFEGKYATITFKKSGNQLRIMGNNDSPGIINAMKEGHNPN